MLSLSLMFIGINLLLVIYLVFTNPFEARKKTTALLPTLLIFYIIYLFDSYINRARIQEWFLNGMMKMDVFSISPISPLASAHFFLGFLIILEIFALSLLIYALYENVFSYIPPILLNKKEKNTRISLSILWKSILFITANLFLVFILKELNYVMQLPLGFLEPIFKLGVSL